MTFSSDTSATTRSSSALTLRRGRPEDAATCGAICYAAFKAITEQHNFPLDFPSLEATQELMWSAFSRSDLYSVVAEIDGRIVGSNVLWENNAIAGVGPVSVDPTAQNSGVGRRMMEDILQRAQQQNLAGVRLVQAGYHTRSLSLYAKLGFDVRELLVNLQGAAIGIQIPGRSVRKATLSDLERCNQLCLKVHGHDRSLELLAAIQQGTATVAEQGDRISGYATTIGFFGHAIGETNEDLKALIAAATEFSSSGFLLPSRNSELFRWCLNQGLRVVQPMTLMSLGSYNEPRGAFLPSILH